MPSVEMPSVEMPSVEAITAQPGVRTCGARLGHFTRLECVAELLVRVRVRARACYCRARRFSQQVASNPNPKHGDYHRLEAHRPGAQRAVCGTTRTRPGLTSTPVAPGHCDQAPLGPVLASSGSGPVGALVAPL
eukprot:scaffold7552_cov47-Phaeocystis_antarctica.AAC.2